MWGVRIWREAFSWNLLTDFIVLTVVWGGDQLSVPHSFLRRIVNVDRHHYHTLFEGHFLLIFKRDTFQRMRGFQLTRDWANTRCCERPVVVPRGQGEGMGMKIPAQLTVRKVAEMLGWKGQVPVIDVITQQPMSWTWHKWVKYYETSPEERTHVYHVMYLV
jgi:hypothetical protein